MRWVFFGTVPSGGAGSTAGGHAESGRTSWRSAGAPVQVWSRTGSHRSGGDRARARPRDGGARPGLRPVRAVRRRGGAAGPSAAALPYSVRFQGVEDEDLLQALKDTSGLYRLRNDAPPDGEGLLRRAEADAPRLVDALSGFGYYAGTATFRIEDVVLGGDAAARSAVRAAEAARNRSLVAVRITVDQGPLYHLRRIAVLDPSGLPFGPGAVPERLTRIDGEVPARSATVLAREAAVVDSFRRDGHPFAKVLRREPVVDDTAHVMDVTFVVDPGPKAAIGAVTVRGTKTVDPAVVRSFIYAEPGDPYSPQALSDIRRSVSRIEALGGVRVREGTALDPDGTLPVFVDVTERARHIVGVSARYSTVDGPGVRAYWADRNLFGGGETLRIDADLSYLGLGTDYYARRRKLAGIETNGLGGRLAATFVKPALFGTRNDLLASAFVGREVQQSYLSDAAGGTVAIGAASPTRSRPRSGSTAASARTGTRWAVSITASSA